MKRGLKPVAYRLAQKLGVVDCLKRYPGEEGIETNIEGTTVSSMLPTVLR